MVIAVAYDNGEVFQHFGQSKNFKLYEFMDGSVIDSAVVAALGEGHEGHALFLADYNVDALICGGIGDGARTALCNVGISIYAGVSGNADACVEQLINGTLDYDPNCSCAHHHEEGHSCGCGHHHEEGQSCGCGHHHEESNGCGCGHHEGGCC